MVKVQNGWESNNLEEVEKLALHRGSPRSSLIAISPTAKWQSVLSPRITTAPGLHRQGSSSVSSEDNPISGRSSKTDHKDHGCRSQQQRTGSRPQKRALAPPADIIPSTQRRPRHEKSPPNGHLSLNAPVPSGPKQRTASQSAAMEADAVETLLFMASPGNSSHHPCASGAMTSSQTSPLRPDFPGRELWASPQRRVAFTELSKTIKSPANTSSRFHEIDRMIDEMDDTSTDGGLEHINEAARVG
jgi:hypothetical protein